MTIARTVWILVLAGISVKAREKILVYVQHAWKAPENILNQAKETASRMFESAGVRIDWHGEAPPRLQPEGAIILQMTSDTPKDFMPGGVVFAFRMRAFTSESFGTGWHGWKRGPAWREVLLAHAMVHEVPGAGMWRHM